MNQLMITRRSKKLWQKTAGKSRLRLTFGCLMLLIGLLSADDAWSQQTTWTNPGVGNWSIASNWSNGVPNTGLFANINDNGLAFIDAPGAGAFILKLGVLSNPGTVEVSGAGRLNLNQIWADNGTLSISAGGQVSTSDFGGSYARTEIGEYSNNGHVIVDGNGSCLNAAGLYTGKSGGYGVLDVRNGGRVNRKSVV
jgi:T5SS/PEP-CTERM-associated repeat protein